MKQRCLWPGHKSYADYGGRGITVCDEWLVYGKGFWQFVEDMGECPEGHELDRIDNNKGYCPENCRWAPRTTQIRNRRPLKALAWTYLTHGRWQSRFRMPDDCSVQVYCGSFETEEEAHLVAAARRLELYWRI